MMLKDTLKVFVNLLMFFVIVIAPLSYGTTAPKLVVVIGGESIQPDRLSHYIPYFTSGLSRLLKQGHTFSEAYLNYAISRTSSGYATISTGVNPASHGIIGDDWWDRETGRRVSSIEDKSTSIPDRPELTGVAPTRMLRGTVGDWLNRENPRAKVFGVSLDDNASLLMAGYRGDCAYWYDNRDGNFISSSYYVPQYPAWVEEFNQARNADDYFVGIWDKLLPDSCYGMKESVGASDKTADVNEGFPHRFSGDGNEPAEKFYDNLRYTPFGDQLSIRFAQELCRREELGTDSIPDLLFIGCSASGNIARRYGPDSREVGDYLVRLDRYLGNLFDTLDSLVGRDSYLTVFTACHGMMPEPGAFPSDSVRGGIINIDSLRAEAMGAGESMAQEMSFDKNPIIDFDGNGLIIDYRESDFKGISHLKIQTALSQRLRKLDHVADVFEADGLASGISRSRAFGDLYVNSFNQERSPDLYLRFNQDWLVGSVASGTSSGSPYDYDTHIPMIFMGASISPGDSKSRVALADIAATISEMLGVSPAGEIDGRSLLPMMQK